MTDATQSLQAPPSPTPTPDPATSGSPTPAPASTPEAKSPAGDPPAGDPPAGDPPAGDPPAEQTTEEQAAAARAVVPEAADAYQVNLADDAREALGLVENDPLVAGLTKFAAENKRPQGWVDDMLTGAAELAKAGLFEVGFDPVAEQAKLGDNAAGRMREVEVFGEALKLRGDIDDAEYGELMSLAPTAAGVSLIEKMRKMMVDGGRIAAPTTPAANATDALQAKAKEMRADARYGKDRAFTAETDEAWRQAWPGAR